MSKRKQESVFPDSATFWDAEESNSGSAESSSEEEIDSDDAMTMRQPVSLTTVQEYTAGGFVKKTKKLKKEKERKCMIPYLNF